ncbi:hypothetical protein [Fulvivirga lutea]|uniref:Haem-binding domain-containing protein n=1 Tax=Fulvivirga lutea TaxID=2810512 RepID=A0A975A1X0_9BACT|nr:hypothetical protein [Fulvivirga lutea]QSE98796.1 hypothetical protein JR347_06880 [Fulvivirga lutea]
MKTRQPLKTILIGIITVIIILLTHMIKAEAPAKHQPFAINTTLSAEVMSLLEAKCNSCHRKKNPFMVFTKKNMNKRAGKIYKQVFVKKRMPKGSKLSYSESELLKAWLESNI